MCEKTAKNTVFQGCHSNRKGCRAEIRYVYSPCGAERTIICFNAVARILSEIWPKNCFSWFYFEIFTQNLSPPTVFGVERWKWARSKRYDVAQQTMVQIFDLGPSSRENGVQSGHCRPKKQFFAVAMATGYQIRDFACHAPKLDQYTWDYQVSSRSAHPFGL